MNEVIKTLVENKEIVIGALTLLLSVSEFLSLFPKVKSNGNLQLVTNIIKKVLSFIKKK